MVLKIFQALDGISNDESVDKLDFIEVMILAAADYVGCYFAINGAEFDTKENRSEVIELFERLLSESIEDHKKIVEDNGIEVGPCECCRNQEAYPAQ